ncbi:MAG: NAD-dependent epimerase/dehydratase family protein [Chitinophagales bacterium]
MHFFRHRRVLLTGGAGSIGGRLAAALLERGATVLVLDDLSSGRREHVPEGCAFTRGDIADAELVAHLFQAFHPEIIFHLAAHFAHANSLDHPVRDLETNALGTLVLLEQAARHGVERFVYASSSCVLAPANGPLAEDALPGGFETPYAISKYVGEEYCRFYAHARAVPVTILRYFNSYGPGDLPGPYRSVVPNFFRAALAGEPLTITGTGQETRDFTYVDDLCRGTLMAAEGARGTFELFHLGSGEAVTINRLAQLINELTGNPAGVTCLPRRPWDHTGDRRADISRAEAQLGYRPQVGLREGLARTLAWFRGQESALSASK